MEKRKKEKGKKKEKKNWSQNLPNSIQTRLLIMYTLNLNFMSNAKKVKPSFDPLQATIQALIKFTFNREAISQR